MPAWYEKSFGEDYIRVYRHRNRQDAKKEIEAVSRWLELKPQEKVLDLCCGTGRHSISLQKMGYQVTGVDLSPALLDVAEKTSQGLGIEYIRGDMRSLPLASENFDAVVNLFTSFGYFVEDTDNRRVFEEISRVLKPSGRFLVDFLNREAVIKNLVPRSEREEDGIHILEERWIEGDFVHKLIRLRDEKGERTYQERVKMYKREQMEEMMASTGLKVEKVQGDFEGNPYSEKESPRMIFRGRRL